VKIRAILASLAVLAASVGCALTLDHKPEEFDLEESWPRVTASGPIAVRAGPAPAGRRSVELPALVFKLDLQDYTRSLVQRVEEALASQSVAIQSGAQRWIELEVVYANILHDGDRFHCVIDFTVRTGNGYVFGHQVRERNSWVDRACNAALSRAAYVSLNDWSVRTYLAAP
jgi:hypothetical protein